MVEWGPGPFREGPGTFQMVKKWSKNGLKMGAGPPNGTPRAPEGGPDARSQTYHTGPTLSLGIWTKLLMGPWPWGRAERNCGAFALPVATVSQRPLLPSHPVPCNLPAAIDMFCQRCTACSMASCLRMACRLPRLGAAPFKDIGSHGSRQRDASSVFGPKCLATRHLISICSRMLSTPLPPPHPTTPHTQRPHRKRTRVTS